MKKILSRHIGLISLLIIVLATTTPHASALDLSTYAENSRLASGNWVKISIPSSGVYLITNNQLRQMGFRDASVVRVYGYGASRLPDRLDRSFIDDLPMVQSITTSRGIIFYGTGPLSWNGDTPVTNPFTTAGYYFLSDIEGQPREIASSGSGSATEGIGEYRCHLLHEEELFSIGQTGHCLVGEDFRYNSSQQFNFSLDDYTPDSQLDISCSFMVNSTLQSSIALTANGSTLPSAAGDLAPAITDSHVHYAEILTNKSTRSSGDKLNVGIRFTSGGTVSAAYLNYISVNYDRPLALKGSPILFSALNNSAYTLSGATQSTLLWDVTDPLDVTRIDVAAESGKISWVSSSGGRRDYVAFDTEGALPSPTLAGRVSNQNLHAEEVPDMVIFSAAEWIGQARRLADFHASSADPLKVLVVDQDQVFNEFSSGARDANAFRKMLKMFYDRSETSDHKLQYALFFGRGTYDNRRITSTIRNIGYPTLPLWQTDRGTSDNDSYSSDDIFAFLRDNSGTNLAADHYCIAVGRMPVTSVSDARNAVDKIIEYNSSMPRNGWRNRALLIADDKDNGVHMRQTETMHSNMMKSSGGTDIVYKKLYTDAYVLEGNTYPAAREDMFRTLKEGVAWLTYIGHASTTSWSHEGLLTYADMNSMHSRSYPVIYAATCDFLRWDGLNPSGAEIMWKLSNGGCIAVISANRPVYIANNGNLSAAMGRWMFNRDADGRRMTIGQIYMNAKNDFRDGADWKADSNKLRYVLMGDPALRPVVPSHRVIVDEINGIDPDSDQQAIMSGGQLATVTGRIVDNDGNRVDDFDGILSTTLYDAEHSITTHGYSNPDKNDGVAVTFEQTGDRLYAGNDSIRRGSFDIVIPMPTEIANNFREATVSFYAYANDAAKENAAGADRRFYVYGYDDNADPDTEAPTIDRLYLNHPTFKNGDVVNRSPMVIAEISDNRGINMSAAGIGHQMTLMLDDKANYNDVNQFYTPSTDGTASGTIAYPLEDLTEGNHTMRLRVWDTAGNSSVAYIDFFVKDGVTPKIYDVYTDSNPASVEANFYLSHDRPDAMIDVTFSVYNMLGQPVWSTTTSGRSDMYLSYPVKWNLTDNAGRRVPRGIYLYRASINADGEQSETVTHRIAVTAP